MLPILRQSHSSWLMLPFGNAEHRLQPMLSSSCRISLVGAVGRDLQGASEHHAFALGSCDGTPATDQLSFFAVALRKLSAYSDLSEI